MASTQGWNALNFRSRSGCPRLFYHFSSKDADIELFITDLIGLWGIKLEADEVLQEAQKQHSSIDPSESRSQGRVLIQKLQQSLAGEGNQLIRQSNLESHVLELRTELVLPKPLKRLEWKFTLKPQGQGTISELILRPCLREASILKRKLESLQNIIKAKDHVITKLLERIENSGTDLSLIFPGITGLKSRKGVVTAKEAKKHVAGLSEFQETEWVSHFDSESSAESDRLGLQSLISGADDCPNHTTKEHEDWFIHLPETYQSAISPLSPDSPESIQPRKQSNESRNGEDDTTASEDDEFERQATPPALRSKRGQSADVHPEGEAPSSQIAKLGRHVPAKKSDQNQAKATTSNSPRKRDHSPESTATESGSEESDKPSSTSKGRNHTSSPSSRRLGRLGPKKSKNTGSDSLRASSPETRSRSTVDKQLDDDDVDASSDEGQDQPPSKQTQSVSAHRLGRLGPLKNKPKKPHSKKKANNSDSETASADDSQPSSANQITASTKSQPSQAESQATPPTEKSNAPEPEPEPEETAEQKANRRREELKKTISAAPVKKKRKF